MKTVIGNLITMAMAGDFDVICHGANCFCSMEAGLALQIKRAFPDAYTADCETISGDTHKFGHFSSADIKRPDGSVFVVVNLYTQYPPGRAVDYPAISSALLDVKAEYAGKRIGIPQIGCGIAGGSWEIVEKIADHALSGEDVTVVIYDRT